MSEDKNNVDADLEAAADAAEDEAVELPQEVPDEEAPEAEMTAAAEEDSAQVAELKDQVLRTLAEMENIKRRAARDVENAHKFAIEKLINELFPVLDSLEKAVETAAETAGAEAISEGVSLSLKLFVDTLAKRSTRPLGVPPCLALFCASCTQCIFPRGP